jgi:Tetrahydrofolate dehydrogenase/cyclohydrolase, catalytic domain
MEEESRYMYLCVPEFMTFDCYDYLIRSLAHIIDGRRISQEIQDDIRSEVEKWTASGRRKPHLSAVLVGEDPASFIYVRNKMRAAENAGKMNLQYFKQVEHKSLILFQVLIAGQLNVRNLSRRNSS